MTSSRVVLVAMAFLLAGCSRTPSVDPRAEEDAIRKLDAEWVKAGQSKQADAWVAFYAEDATVLPPNEPMATDKASIRKSVAGLLGLPGLAITWQVTKVEVAASGDLGYLYGKYEVSFDEAPGKRTTDRGKIVEIWKKQADGHWKCIVDIWNTDLPLAPAPAS